MYFKIKFQHTYLFIIYMKRYESCDQENTINCIHIILFFVFSLMEFIFCNFLFFVDYLMNKILEFDDHFVLYVQYHL